MKLVLGMEVDLSPGDFVLDEDPVNFPQKRADPSPIFGPFLLWPNGCMHQDATWYVGRPQPGDLVLDGDAAPPPKFSAHVYCGQTAGWNKMTLGMEVGLGPVHIVLDGDTAPLPKREQSPQFSAHLYCGKGLDASICHMVWRLSSAQATLC